jgi:hypothetical protein
MGHLIKQVGNRVLATPLVCADHRLFQHGHGNFSTSAPESFHLSVDNACILNGNKQSSNTTYFTDLNS